MMMAMADQEGSHTIHQVIANDDSTAMVSAKPAGSDTIYWYYVDQKSKVHSIPGGI
jgi:hypothetical protein